MSFDLAQDETRQRLQSLPGATAVEPGAFDSFLTGTGMSAMRTFAQAGRALDLAANAPALAFGQLTGRYEAIDRFFREREESGTQRAVDYWTPKPGEVGVAGEVVGTLLSTLPLVIANPAIAIGQFGLTQAEEVARKGVSPGKAAAVGVGMGAGFGLGVWMPILGQNLVQRMLVGGAGFNVVQGAAMRGLAGEIVAGTPAADMYHAFDPTELTIDAILGLAFGALVHRSPAARAQGEQAVKNIHETWVRLQEWAHSLKPSDIDALASLRQAQHKNADSLGGRAAGPEDVDAHVARVNRALEQVVADEPVNVQDMPQAKLEPYLDQDARSEEANRTLRDLEAEAFRLADEEQIPLAPEQRPAYRAVREALETLGQFGEPERDAYARTVSAFYESAAKRTGIAVADLLERHPLKVSGEAPTGAALEQGAPGPFYSELGRQIEAAKMKAAPAKGWKDFIRGLGQKGVKPDEVKWSGIEEWLDAQEGRVTKEAVQAFLEQGGVKVEEVMLGAAGERTLGDAAIADDIELLNANGFRAETNSEDTSMVGFYDVENDDIVAADELRGFARDEPGLAVLADAAERIERYWNGEGGTAPSTKFGQYVLPGGQNYRELLLTLPEREPSEDGLAPRKEIFDRYQPRIDALRREHEALAGRDGVMTERLRLATEAERLENERDAAANKAYTLPADRGAFRSPHFDQPNILAHVRFNERTDAEGKRVLFIEEIQSDWAQKGRREGFRPAGDEYFLRKPDGDIGRDFVSREEGERYLRDHPNAGLVDRAHREGVPAAPFVGKTEAWVALTLKRMIRYASENGFDRVSWTTGEQQAERYDLSKVLSSVEATKARHREGEAHYDVIGRNNNMRDGLGNKVIEKTVAESELADTVGKELAERIIREGGGTYRGLDLKVGGEGMKSFYDTIVPGVARDVLKKLGGGKVGEIDVGSTGSRYSIEPIEQVNRFRVVDTEANQGNGTFVTEPLSHDAALSWVASKDTAGKQSGFDITPELRERATTGMPLFQGGPEQPRGYFQMGEGGPKIGLLAAADRSTFLHESGHFFLEVTNDLAGERSAPAELRADMQRLLDWFGVEQAKWDSMTLDEKRPHHEKFARGFEAYLREGKAPTPELSGIFGKFKAWLTEIYRSLRDLNVTISDDVRGVMDRMLGAEPIAPAMPKPTMPQRTSLIDDIRALGGIRKDALLDITGEARTGRGVKGLPPGLFKDGGAGLDDLATQLRDKGWPIPEDAIDGGVQGLRDLIASELGGKTTLKVDEDPNVLKPLEEQDAAQVFERYAELETKMSEKYDFRSDNPELQAEVRRLRTQRDYELASVLSGEGLHVEAEARHMAAENPDLEVTIGENADGTPIKKTAREFLDDAEREAKAIEDEEPLMIEAAECMLGTG